jgi:galactose-1-phosphate uridylyltransferase
MCWHAELSERLRENAIWIHPAVIGELVTGNLSQREKTLQVLLALRRTKLATFEECLATIGALGFDPLITAGARPGARIYATAVVMIEAVRA